HEAQLRDLARRKGLKFTRRKPLHNKDLLQQAPEVVSTDSAVFRPFWPRSVQVVCRVGSALRLPVEILSNRDHTFSGAGSGHPVRNCLPPAGFSRPSSEASPRSVDGGASLRPAADVTSAPSTPTQTYFGVSDRNGQGDRRHRNA